jgi:hypothetical protein
MSFVQKCQHQKCAEKTQLTTNDLMYPHNATSGGSDMRKYEPKIGRPIDLQPFRFTPEFIVDVLMILLGFTLVFLCWTVIDRQIAVHGQSALWLSAILAIGVAAMTAGIAGTLNVEYRGSKLVASGSLGLAAFLLVYVISVKGLC